jgi:hypothetical protein
MQKPEVTAKTELELVAKQTEELEKSVASDLTAEDNDEKFRESIDNAKGTGSTDDQEDSDTAI